MKWLSIAAVMILKINAKLSLDQPDQLASDLRSHHLAFVFDKELKKNILNSV